MTTITEVIELLGGRINLAKQLNVSPQAIFKWEKTKITPARAIQIQDLTDGVVTVRDLRPDLFKAA